MRQQDAAAAGVRLSVGDNPLKLSCSMTLVLLNSGGGGLDLLIVPLAAAQQHLRALVPQPFNDPAALQLCQTNPDFYFGQTCRAREVISRHQGFFASRHAKSLVKDVQLTGCDGAVLDKVFLQGAILGSIKQHGPRGMPIAAGAPGLL